MDGELEEYEKTKMVRRRRSSRESRPYFFSEAKSDLCSSNIFQLSNLLAAAFLICSWSLIYSLAFYFNHRLPSMVTDDATGTDSDGFIGERAKLFLSKLAATGVKVPGSYELDIRAFTLLDDEIKTIIKHSNQHNQNKISYDIQKPTGAFNLGMPMGFISVYRNVTNLIVKIGPGNASQNDNIPGLLINCHYDSAPSSPGASDDGLNCAVMLEVLRILSKQQSNLRNNLIFLFNGAEETPLQASHGFITQHEWAKNLSGFINLESCGAGGREALFQTGPKNSWIVELYKKAVKHPFGLVLAEDLFQGGLVPSDTDFRIFRDFGKIPGLDFAHCDNGYVYHTRFDDVNNIRDGVFQHTGDNLLAMVRLYANQNDAELNQNSDSRTVYFDLLGIYFISYPEKFAYFINFIAVLLSSYTVFNNVMIYTAGMNRKKRLNQLLMCVLVPVLGLLLAAIYIFTVAAVLDKLNASLSWYSKPYLVLPLYFLPTFVGLCLPPLLLNKIKSSNLCDGVRVQLYCNGFQMLWTIMLFFATVFSIRSAYVLLLTVLSMAIVNYILALFYLQHDVSKWLIAFCSSSIVPAIYFVYLYILAFRLFIPIAGRSGANINPDFLIGALAAVLCSLIYGYTAPLIILVKKPWKIIYGFIIVNVLVMIAVVTTDFGFPFSKNMPERLLMLDTDRMFFGKEGVPIYNDSGLWMLYLDRRAPSTYGAIPWYKDAVNVDSFCDKYLYCGLPFYYTRIASTERNPGSWIPKKTGPKLSSEIKVKLNSCDEILTNLRKFNFSINCPHQALLFISPKENVQLVSIDLSVQIEGVKWGNRPTYIIRFTSGGYQVQPEFSFFVELSINADFKDDNGYLDLAVAGHYIEDMGKDEANHMKIYPQSFHEWAHVTSWNAAYRSYVF